MDDFFLFIIIIDLHLADITRVQNTNLYGTAGHSSAPSRNYRDTKPSDISFTPPTYLHLAEITRVQNPKSYFSITKISLIFPVITDFLMIYVPSVDSIKKKSFVTVFNTSSSDINAICSSL